MLPKQLETTKNNGICRVIEPNTANKRIRFLVASSLRDKVRREKIAGISDYGVAVRGNDVFVYEQWAKKFLPKAKAGRKGMIFLNPDGTRTDSLSVACSKVI